MHSIVFSYCYAECRYTECRYAECHYAECRYAECRYAECRYAECIYAECNDARKAPCMLAFSVCLHAVSQIATTVTYSFIIFTKLAQALGII
jgi:hypothetical protein